MTKRKLAKQTSKAIKKLSGKETINSGATFQDNDFNIKFPFPICWGTWDSVSGESKFTEKQSYVIKNQLMRDIRKEAKGNLPVLHLGFVENTKQEEYIIVSADDFNGILQYIAHLQNELLQATADKYKVTL